MGTRVLKRLLPMCTVLMVCLVGMPGMVLAVSGTLPDVSVYAEGAYSDTELVLYIYADITESEPILSFGVRVEYPSTLEYSAATKNTAAWYFGAGTSEYSYMDPENDETGVVIIGGKLNTNNPTEGVGGDRVLLGTVTFTHDGVTDFSEVSVTYGRGDGTGDYKNFVDVDGDVVDGSVSFSAKIRERGDANGDNDISSADMFTIRSKMESQEYSVWADCNGDSDISSADLFCVRNKM